MLLDRHPKSGIFGPCFQPYSGPHFAIWLRKWGMPECSPFTAIYFMVFAISINIIQYVCIYIYMYIYMYIYIYVYIYMYIYMYIYVYIYMYMYIYICMYIYMYMYIYIYVYIYVYIYICMYIYICIYIYMYIYICIYIYMYICIYIYVYIYIYNIVGSWWFFPRVSLYFARQISQALPSQANASALLAAINQAIQAGRIPLEKPSTQKCVERCFFNFIFIAYACAKQDLLAALTKRKLVFIAPQKIEESSDKLHFPTKNQPFGRRLYDRLYVHVFSTPEG